MANGTSGVLPWLALRLRVPVFFFPLTGPGIVLAVTAFGLAGTAFAAKNAYAFLFALLAVLYLALAGLLARIQAFRLSRVQILWDSSSNLTARIGAVVQRLHTGEFRPFYFFRLHFLLHGRLEAGRGCPLYVRFEGASSGGGEIQIPMEFPAAGPLQVKGRLLVRDVFGFVRAQVTADEERTLVVRPPLFPDPSAVRFRTMFSNESARKMTSADEDKYVMREYIPGDRIKDINWKASMRISELITRISPMSPEESRLVHVSFRNFRSGLRDSPSSILHLNYVKSWLLSFLFTVKREHGEFQFRVLTGRGAQLLKSEDDLHRFTLELAAMPFLQESQAERDRDPTIRERFVFSTAFDEGLSAAVAAEGHIKNHVFRTVRPSSGQGRKTRVVHFLSPFDVHVLPGFWFLRPERSPRSGSVSVRGSLIQEPLKVKRI